MKSKLAKYQYITVYEKLRQDIVSGAYEYGEKLPSKRTLSENMGISVITVEHAYSLLAEEGYISSRERSGYFSVYRKGNSFPVSESTQQAAFSDIQAIKSEEKDSFPFSVYARTMRRVLTEYGEKILIKSPNTGCIELKNAITRYLARSRGINVSPDEIIIGSGAEYLYGMIVQLLGRDKTYAIETPSYEKIEKVYLSHGLKCEHLPLGVDGIESFALNNSHSEILHISPYRSFPSGVTASASKKREYLSWAERTGGYIIEDDFESEFTTSTKPEDTVFSLSENGRVIYINTFSKTIAPSVRIGYMVLPKQLLQEFNDKIGFYSCTVPTFEQLVLTEFINNGDFERHINRVRRQKRRSVTGV